MPRQRLAKNAQRARVDRFGRCAVSCAADRVREPSGLAQLSNQFPARAIDIFRMLRMYVHARPFFDFRGKLLVPRLQKRPIEMASSGQFQSPLNTGFCFSTNA